MIADPSGSWEPSTAQEYIDSQVGVLNTNIANETVARQNGDQSLQNQINAEAITRANIDNTKADKATTLAGYGITNAYTKTEVNDLVDIPHQNYVTVQTYSALPATGSADTIYRVSSYDGSVPEVNVTKYSEYAWNGSQYIFLCVKSQIDEIFDITVYHSNTTYSDLAAALGTNGDNIPPTLRRGGMSIKFVQTSDNKYVQWRYMGTDITGNPNPFLDTTNWQNIDTTDIKKELGFLQSFTAIGRNSDFELETEISQGETIRLTIANATNTYNVVLCNSIPFSQLNPYQSLRNASDNVTFEVESNDNWKYLHLFDSSEGNVLNVTLAHEGSGILEEINEIQEDIKDNVGNYVCLGDSITSDEITGIGTLICNELEATKVGNFAHGNAHCSNWHRLNTDVTPVTFDTLVNANTPDNVLSNQVIRILRNTTPLGQQVKWTHPTAGEQSIPVEVGTGLGNISQIPNVIYIAISTNDGKVVSGYSENVGGEGQYGGQTGIGDNTPTPVTDNCDIVFEQAYNQLDKMSIASALRWSIETLRCVYPNAAIFVASPLQTNYGYITSEFGNKLNFIKSEIVKKVCKFCSVYFIDSYGESGYSDIIARTKGGIHPGNEWKQYIAKYVANRIRIALKKTKNDLYY